MAVATSPYGQIHIEGLDVLERRLKELGRRTAGNYLRKALRKGANVVKEEAKARVLVRTGKLKKSIAVEVSMKASGDVHAKIGFKKGAAYGVPVELGHTSGGRHVAARPFLRPAVDVKHGDAVNAFANRLKVEIQQAVTA